MSGTKTSNRERKGRGVIPILPSNHAQKSCSATIWQPHPHTNLPKINVAIIAKLKKINPAFTSPFCSVYIDSDGSIGEIVEPEISHCMTCATIISVSKIRAAARQRLMDECLISIFCAGAFGRTGSSRFRFFVWAFESQAVFIIQRAPNTLPYRLQNLLHYLAYFGFEKLQKLSVSAIILELQPRCGKVRAELKPLFYIDFALILSYIKEQFPRCSYLNFVKSLRLRNLEKIKRSKE